MYMEDYDLCFRSRNKGFDVMFTKNIQTIHHLSSGKKWIGKRALKWTVEGYKIFLEHIILKQIYSCTQYY